MFTKILHTAWKIVSNRVLLLILLIAAVSAGGVVTWKYVQSQDEVNKLANQQAAAEELTKKAVNDVGKIFELPTDETPTIATVTDKESLQSQPFFARSENGDQVLIYTNAQRAILYRPSTGKIIDVTTINNQTASAESTETTETTPPENLIKLALYNGTTTPGLTNKVADTLAANFPQTTVAIKSNASKTDYTQTQVIDVSGSNQQLAQQIATSLNGVLTTLPPEEIKPNADILVILAVQPT